MISVKQAMAFMLRPRRKSLIIGLIVFWIAVSFLFFHSMEEIESTKDYDFGSIEETDLKKLLEDEKKAHDNVRTKVLENDYIQLYLKFKNVRDIRNVPEAHSSVYDQIFADHDINGVLEQLLFDERCDLYFSRMYIHDPNWKLDPNMDVRLDMRDQFKFKDYRNAKMDELKKEMAEEKNVNKDDIKVDDDFEKKMKDKYTKFWTKTMNDENRVVDALSHLRIFNKCYLMRDDKIVSNEVNNFIKVQRGVFSKLKSKGGGKIAPFKKTTKERLFKTDGFTCSALESRIYPWLSRTYPIFERWNGEVLHSLPNMKKYLRHAPSYVFEPSNKAAHDGKGKGTKIKSSVTGNNKNCFMHKFKLDANGKGIVLSIGDKHYDEAARLIRLLRALNNRYPIQIVYNDGLSEITKTRLIKVARETYNTLPTSFDAVRHMFPNDYLDAKEGGLPKQELWFVNVNSAINDQYKGKFQGFSNKFLATLFNSFEEFLLVDADTVMMQHPDFFFKLENFVDNGAFFYKDRTAPHFRPAADSVFFKKITPSLIDQTMFDIPVATRKSLDIDFFHGMFYYMESGLVVLNRNIHFDAILMMIQMNFYDPVAKRVYGDKEIFWLAFVTVGHENYHFNEFYAAAIGEETPMEDRVENSAPRLFKSRELCAAHPAHIGAESGYPLHWFNSGFRFCGQSEKVDYEKEFKQGKRYKWLKSKEEMKTFYSNPMKIRHAVIPPFKDKLETLCENVEGEPKEAWKMDSKYCNSYLWCAYSRIGGKTSLGIENTQQGKFIEFEQDKVDLFSYYGDIWVDNE